MMMDSVAEQQRRLDELRRIRADGIRSLRDQNGEEVVFRSDRELAAAIAALESDMERARRGRPSQIKFQTSKGVM